MASESINIQNFFNRDNDTNYENKSFWGHLRVSKFKISSTMVKMKSTKMSIFGASEITTFQTLFNHGGDEDGEKESHQNDGAENFLTWLYWRSLAHAKTFQNDVWRIPYIDSTLAPDAAFAKSSLNTFRLRRSLTRFARLHISFAPLLQICAR